MSSFKNQTNTTAPPRDEIYRLYVVERLSCEDIGKVFDLAATTIWRWLQRYEITPRTKKEARQIAKKTVYSPEGLASKQRAAAAMRTRITAESHAKQAASMKGREPPNKGKPQSEEARLKSVAWWDDPAHRLAAKERMSGEKSPNWRGGTKVERDRRLDTAEWRRIRRKVYERDNWTCQDCKQATKNFRDSKKDPRRRVQAHHIKSRRNGGSDDLSNLVTLCMSCHHKRERAENPRPLPPPVA